MKASKNGPKLNLKVLDGKRKESQVAEGSAVAAAQAPDWRTQNFADSRAEGTPGVEESRAGEALDFAFDPDRLGDASPVEADAEGVGFTLQQEVSAADEDAAMEEGSEPAPTVAFAIDAVARESRKTESRSGQAAEDQKVDHVNVENFERDTSKRRLREQRANRRLKAGAGKTDRAAGEAGEHGDERQDDVQKRSGERSGRQRSAGRKGAKKGVGTMPIPVVRRGNKSRSSSKGWQEQRDDGQPMPSLKAPKSEPRDQPQLETAEQPVAHVVHGLRFVFGFFKSLLLLAMIVGPMLVAGYYYFFVAADRYEVRTVFLIRTAGVEVPTVTSILGQPQAFGRAADESFSVVDYVQSYEGLVRLEQLVDLRAMYSLPKDDLFYYLPADSTLLDLHAYYLRMIDAAYDQITGLVSIDVRAFTPSDALAISEAMLVESERLINEFNTRAQADLLALARREVAEALATLEDAEQQLTQFRQTNNVINPMEVIVRVNGIIATLEGEIAKSEAELVQLGKVTGNRGGVARLELEARIESLRIQVQREHERLVGQQESLGNLIPEFELLSLRKELAGQAYSASLASMQSSIAQAQRQQLYVVPVVAPTELDQAQLPDRWESLFFVFLVVLLVFTIGRLLILGIRDHIL